MRVDFATYGERKGAHSALWASFDDPVVAKGVFITDLPWGLPERLGHGPMFQGRSLDSYYVVTRTLRDPNASRPGMAMSLAAFIPLADLTRLDDLGIILDTLELVDPPTGACEVAPKKPALGQLPVGFPQLVHALLASDTGQAPVWIGQESFRPVLEALWSRMPGEVRFTFSFAFICDPSDSNKANTALLYCPNDTASRWTGHTVVEPTSPMPVLGSAELFFLQDDQRADFSHKLATLGARVRTFSDLRAASQCIQAARESHGISTFDITKLIRKLGALSPNPLLGLELKESLISELCRRIVREGSASIVYIRNIDLSPFPAAAGRITQSCRDAIQSELTGFASGCSDSCVALIKEAFKDAQRPWQFGIQQGASTFVARGDAGSGALLWLLVRDSADIDDWLSALIPLNVNADELLSRFPPEDASANEWQSILSMAANRQWPLVYSMALARTVDPADAIRHVCDAWKGEARTNALRQLASQLGPDVFLAAIDGTDSPDAINCAAELCVEAPMLLTQHFRGASKAWRFIFELVAAQRASVIPEAPALRNELDAAWQFALTGSLEASFQVAAAQTCYANLIDSTVRSQIWQHLDKRAADAMLAATAEAWIGRFHSISETVAPERELAKQICHTSLRSRLLPMDMQAIKKVVQAFDLFHDLSEDDFDAWRQDFLSKNRHIAPIDAALIGGCVRQHGWKYVASRLASDVRKYSRDDLRPAVTECFTLLGFIDKILVGSTNFVVESDEWWAEVKTVLCDLYPEGPLAHNIWERAGGDPADLVHSISGADAWYRCLRDLRNGFSSGTLSLDSLLGEASEDYPGNSALRVLSKYRPR
ncbi:MAG TPA: effector-associated domain EAD1-containing protein [Pirellulales bacterium]|nr:effector-associated domain EAD1-containing protein [Pirellulales bacterium]